MEEARTAVNARVGRMALIVKSVLPNVAPPAAVRFPAWFVCRVQDAQMPTDGAGDLIAHVLGARSKAAPMVQSVPQNATGALTAINV